MRIAQVSPPGSLGGLGLGLTWVGLPHVEELKGYVRGLSPPAFPAIQFRT